jgi:hypothetical protein
MNSVYVVLLLICFLTFSIICTSSDDAEISETGGIGMGSGGTRVGITVEVSGTATAPFAGGCEDFCFFNHD